MTGQRSPSEIVLEVFRRSTWALTRPWRLPPAQVERHLVHTDDGWTLTLSRVRNESAPALGPVLLMHGLAASEQTFLMPRRNLAQHLAEAGFDVWIGNLRGRRDLTWYDKGRPAYDWTVDDYVDRDVPAIVARVLEESGAERLQWVGQSMGGLLLVLYGIQHGGELLSAGISMGSALDYQHGHNAFQGLVKLRELAAGLPWVPVGSAFRLFAPLAGRWRTPIERFNHHPENMDPALVRTYYANVFQDVSPGVLLQLATTFEEGGLRRLDGAGYLDRAEKFTVPIFAMVGDVDREVSPEAVSRMLDAIGSSEKKLQLFGPAHGDASSYGHFDLLVGEAAPMDTWPRMVDWLRAHAPDSQ